MVEVATFAQKLDLLRELHDRKSADYGADEDPLANVRASQNFGVPPWVGAMIRLNDKVVRVQSLIKNGKLLNESIEDSFKDIAVYAIISWQLYEEQMNANNVTLRGPISCGISSLDDELHPWGPIRQGP